MVDTRINIEILPNTEIEAELNRHGLTLSDKAKHLQIVVYSAGNLWYGGFISNEEYDKIKVKILDKVNEFARVMV